MTLDYGLRRQWSNNIRTARKTANLTQAELGDLCGVDQCTVSRWERAKLIPSEANKIGVAKALGANARDMFPLTALVPEAAAS